MSESGSKGILIGDQAAVVEKEHLFGEMQQIFSYKDKLLSKADKRAESMTKEVKELWEGLEDLSILITKTFNNQGADRIKRLELYKILHDFLVMIKLALSEEDEGRFEMDIISILSETRAVFASLGVTSYWGNKYDDLSKIEMAREKKRKQHLPGGENITLTDDYEVSGGD